jgi:hypothetical protein
VWLVLLGVAAVGLSNTALYLIPAIIGCSCLSFLSVELLGRKRPETIGKLSRHCLLLAIPLVYPIAILVLLKLNVIPKPTDTRAFGPEFTAWRQPLENVLGWFPEYLRDIAIMVGRASADRSRQERTLPLLLCLCCLADLFESIARALVDARSCCFLLSTILSPAITVVMRNVSSCSSSVNCVAARLAQGPDPNCNNPFGSRSRFLLQLPHTVDYAEKPEGRDRLEVTGRVPITSRERFLAQAAGKYIAHSKLLAPCWTASCELPLLFPEMKAVAPRHVAHYFANAGNPEEGILRSQAQAFVEPQETNDPQHIQWLAAQFRIVIESGRADAVAVPESESARVLTVLQTIDPGWHRVLEAGGLVLMLPRKAEPESPE